MINIDEGNCGMTVRLFKLYYYPNCYSITTKQKRLILQNREEMMYAF